MSKENNTQTPAISMFIKDLCKGRAEEELQEAEENFREYLQILKEICERLDQEGTLLSDFDSNHNL